jgi:hypothetical protein
MLGQPLEESTEAVADSEATCLAALAKNAPAFFAITHRSITSPQPERLQIRSFTRAPFCSL